MNPNQYRDDPIRDLSPGRPAVPQIPQPPKPWVKGPGARRKDTAMISGHAVDTVAIQLLRYGAWLILLASFVGSVATFNGGWTSVLASMPRFWEGVSLRALALGVGLQLVLTIMEWHNRRKRRALWYVLPLVIDIALTVLGFSTLVLPLFADILIGYAVLAIGSILVAVLPEMILVD